MKLIIAILSGTLLLGAGLLGWIGYEIKVVCNYAKSTYGGSCVPATVQLIGDEKQSYSWRNRGIWTLGQLGDAKALPSLQALYTGVIPAREPLESMISQYELQKAIALTQGSWSITGWWWRNSWFRN